MNLFPCYVRTYSNKTVRMRSTRIHSVFSPLPPPPVGTSRAGGKYGIIYLVMTVQEISDTVQYRTLVKDYRDTCLWFADGRLVDHPSDVRQLGMILASIESNGDANAFRRAGEIRQWL